MRLLLTRKDDIPVIIPLDKVEIFEPNDDETTKFHFLDGNVLDVKEDQWYIHSIISRYELDKESS